MILGTALNKRGYVARLPAVALRAQAGLLHDQFRRDSGG